MEISIIATYKDIFGDDPPEFSDLISGIPTKQIVALVSVMNGELYLNQSDFKTHLKILGFLLQRQTYELRQLIVKKITAQLIKRGSDDYSLFSTHLNLHFLHYSLQYFHEDENFVDTTPEEELNLFKAYLVTSSRLFDNMEIDINTESPLDYFRKNTWPMMIGQFQLNQAYNYFLAIVKSKCFFDALEFESEYGEYLKHFTERFKDPNSFTYLFRFANTLQLALKGDQDQRFAPFSVKPDSLSNGIFEELSIDLKYYNKNYSNRKSNFTGLKEKPLYKVSENSYLIISWDFLARKIYDGMLFDFYDYSGIANERRFKNFPSFKQFVGKEAIEKYLFRRLIKGCFKEKQCIIKFDCEERSGQPDAYVRKGKRIFLFEIKDSLFQSMAIDSEEYILIKDEIDKKYNAEKPKRKGTYQLLNQLESLSQKPFEDKSYSELKLKIRNLIIYPIIIYTDSHFDLPGIGKYLDEEFQDMIKNKGFNQKFGKIKNLTFMNIDFLISQMNQFQKKDTTLEKIINAAISELNKRSKRFKRTNSTEDLMLLNDNFHSLSSGRLEEFDADSEYVKVLFNELNLNRGVGLKR